MSSPGEWWLKASCWKHPDPDLWHPATPASPAAVEAKRICRGCPVRRECGADAADHDVRSGIAAGFNTGDIREWERLHTWLGRKPPADGRQLVRCECGAEFATGHGYTRCTPCRQGFIPVAVVLEHLEELVRAMTYQEIGRRAGLSTSAVSVIRRQAHIRPETAQRILAVAVAARGRTAGAR